ARRVRDHGGRLWDAGGRGARRGGNLGLAARRDCGLSRQAVIQPPGMRAPARGLRASRPPGREGKAPMVKNRHSKTLALSLVTVISALGCSRAMGSPAQPDLTAEPKAAVGQQVPVTTTPNPVLGKAGGAIADVAERALPSVVNISLTKVGRAGAPIPFPFFFGPPQERIEQGMGSGVIVSADGTILTNNHVVADAKEIKVTTYDRREFDAKVIGTDPKSDLAVIQIQGAPAGLTPIQFGDSSKLRLGEIVLAIGNPFGVGQTVTMGIVSAKGRADLGIVD